MAASVGSEQATPVEVSRKPPARAPSRVPRIAESTCPGAVGVVGAVVGSSATWKSSSSTVTPCGVFAFDKHHPDRAGAHRHPEYDVHSTPKPLRSPVIWSMPRSAPLGRRLQNLVAAPPRGVPP